MVIELKYCEVSTDLQVLEPAVQSAEDVGVVPLMKRMWNRCILYNPVDYLMNILNWIIT